MLAIQNLSVAVDGKEILKNLSLTIQPGKVHAVMGPNGSGKSTLSNTIMGHPYYEVVGGAVTLNGENILELSVDQRARKGIFLAFQYPKEIPGVPLSSFLRAAYNARLKERGTEALNPIKFRKLLREKMNALSLDASFMNRYVNDGFSGGEKKKAEILQMSLLEPRIAILDETDSGLDVDALRIVAEGIKKTQTPERGTLIITHYQRILHYITPDFVHVMINGTIVKSGGKELAERLERDGYDWIKKECGIAPENDNGLKTIPAAA
ncbi:MAG: FeS assembly ATPase SufC [Candidatus Peregrinibacteria bacterium GW2011_GWA2_47_7]|nr:MAG: FeS assembly ATPase SufC [Candidatus Peregrinibacteria bacterium GW2011_GWA2_47_7]